MAIFPRLKTGAVGQYPLTRHKVYRNQIVTFIDGTDQRYRDAGAPRQRWEVRLSALDEAELAAFEEFFLANQGAFGSFTFTDPWDDRVYSDCSLELDEMTVTSAAEMRGFARFTVVENR